MKECFIPKRFSAEALQIIDQCNAVLEGYAAQGYDLTVRQLYYQFVAHNWIPIERTWIQVDKRWVRSPKGSINAEPNYKWLGGIINDARLAGLIDWDHIKDRGRIATRPQSWPTPQTLVEQCASYYHVDHWEDQGNYVEVMVEKQALEGVLLPVCRSLDVYFTANKGYSSSSAMYDAAQRYLAAYNDGRDLYCIYLGDHDPSGIDMSRDVAARLSMFVGRPVEVRRAALNIDQVREFKLPENPTKMADSRSVDYVKRFGMSCWELDALSPQKLADLVKAEVLDLRDPDVFDRIATREDRDRQWLRKIAARTK